MDDPIQYEEDYHQFISNLQKWIPDGIIEVNLQLLGNLGLLEESHWENLESEEKFPHYFHVVEASEKVTLYNDQFVVWIVPKMIGDQAITLTLISLLVSGKPRLEIVFSTKGIYNTPKCILKVLKHYLEDVIDIQEVISSINNGSAH